MPIRQSGISPSVGKAKRGAASAACSVGGAESMSPRMTGTPKTRPRQERSSDAAPWSVRLADEGGEQRGDEEPGAPEAMRPAHYRSAAGRLDPAKLDIQIDLHAPARRPAQKSTAKTAAHSASRAPAHSTGRSDNGDKRSLAAPARAIITRGNGQRISAPIDMPISVSPSSDLSMPSPLLQIRHARQGAPRLRAKRKKQR